MDQPEKIHRTVITILSRAPLQPATDGAAADWLAWVVRGIDEGTIVGALTIVASQEVEPAELVAELMELGLNPDFSRRETD